MYGGRKKGKKSKNPNIRKPGSAPGNIKAMFAASAGRAKPKSKEVSLSAFHGKQSGKLPMPGFPWHFLSCLSAILCISVCEFVRVRLIHHQVEKTDVYTQRK